MDEKRYNDEWKRKLRKPKSRGTRRFLEKMDQRTESRANHKKGAERMWKNRSKEEAEKLVKKIMMNRRLKQSDIEVLFEGILKIQNLPYKFVGSGGFLIGTKVPDFVHTGDKKICIEVFHSDWKNQDYGSVENYIKQRTEEFSKYGWKTLFFSESDIYRNIESVVKKIKDTELEE